MHLQENLNMNEYDCMLRSLDLKPAIRAPPGLSLEPEAGKTSLSLMALCGGPGEPLCPPPGLEKMDAPPGLPPPAPRKGSDSGSDNEQQPLCLDLMLTDEKTVDSGSDNEQQPLCLDLMLTDEKAVLKASSPLFIPTLTPAVAAGLKPLPDKAQRTPLRTKLCAKAGLYVPSAANANFQALPFVPMAAVEESWQNWHMQNSSYRRHAELANDSVTDWQSNAHGDGQYYPQQAWAY